MIANKKCRDVEQDLLLNICVLSRYGDIGMWRNDEFVIGHGFMHRLLPTAHVGENMTGGNIYFVGNGGYCT